MKGNNLEGMVALCLFLAGWIFAQVLSLSQPILKSIESVAVISASLATIGAVVVALKAYKAWNKPTVYAELKEVDELLGKELQCLIKITLHCSSLQGDIKYSEIIEVEKSRSAILDLLRNFLISRLFLHIKIDQLIPEDSDDGIALRGHLQEIMDAIDRLRTTVVNSSAKLIVDDMLNEELGAIGKDCQDKSYHLIKCSQIIRNRLKHL